jgi:hypothetical protein
VVGDVPCAGADHGERWLTHPGSVALPGTQGEYRAGPRGVEIRARRGWLRPDPTTAARPSPRRTFEESGTTSVLGSSLSSWIRAGRSAPSSSLESWTPTLPQPRSPHPHNGTRASRKLPSSDSITATPSDSSGLPAHASMLSGATPRPVHVTTSLRPRRTPMTARQSSPPSISTRSARTLQPSPASCRCSGLAVTTSAMKPSYERHR